MAVHRYWRAIRLEAYARGALELSEFQLLDGATRADAGATLSASVAPSSGSLASLADNSTTAAVTWSSTVGLAIVWDLGAATEVNNIKLGSAADAAKFLGFCTLQWSDDNSVWTTFDTYWGIAWPQPRAMTANEPYGGWFKGLYVYKTTLSAGGDIAFYQPDASRSAIPNGPRKPPGTTGKFQVEFSPIVTSISGSTIVFGFNELASAFSAPGQDARSWAYASSGQRRNAGSGVSYGAAFTLNDVIGAVVDFDAGSITFYKNGASQGVAYTGIANLSFLMPAVASLNYGPVFQASLKTKGFTYPVAGVEPWEARTTGIVTTAGLAVQTPEARTGVKTADGTLVFGRSHLPQIVLGRKDYLTGVLGKGIGRISGTVKEDGTPDMPVWRRVRLMRESDGLIVRERWSHPVTGAYQFDFVDELQKYTVLSYDHNHNFRAVVADNLTPDVIASGVSNPTEVAPSVFLQRVHTNFKVVGQAYQNTMGSPSNALRTSALCVVARTSGFQAAAQPTSRWVLVGSASATVGSNTLAVDFWYQPDAPIGGESIGFFQAGTTSPMNGQIFYLESSVGPPKLASFAAVSANNTTATTLALPVVTAPRDGSIIVGAAASFLAAATPSLTTIGPDPGWQQITPLAGDQTRIGVFAQPADAGQAPAANAIFTGLPGASNALVAVAAVFTPF